GRGAKDQHLYRSLVARRGIDQTGGWVHIIVYECAKSAQKRAKMPIFGSEVSANRARDLILRAFRARFATSNMVCDDSFRGARA
ncbi:MAG: hypothetical protein O2955_18100, partial [Planctomycetota bacterium]|nr:hypothetical protein [Planctomycetota bacterium]